MSKGEKNGLCYRKTCQGHTIARHKSNNKYYCQDCARQLNTLHYKEALELYDGPLLEFPEDYNGNIYVYKSLD